MNIHFILDNDINYDEFMGIYSAYIINSPKILYIHYNDSNLDKNVNFKTLALLKNVEFKILGYYNDIIHKKLDILYEFGGIILDKNIICHKKFDLYDKDLILFRDFTKHSDITNILSKTIIMGKKNSKMIKDYIHLYKSSKKFIYYEELYDIKEVLLIQDRHYLYSSDTENILDITIFYYDSKDSTDYKVYKDLLVYKTLIKNIKNKMIVKTPKNDSLYYAIADLLINSNRISNVDLSCDRINVDILSIKYSEVYTSAKDHIKTDIENHIVNSDKNEYNVNKIIEIVNKIYNVPIEILSLHQSTEKNIKISRLKNILINVVDNYYITIK